MSTVPNEAETRPAVADTGTPVLLRPRDPLIFRDARPFAADPGARAFSLTWPLPRTTAGALRTHVINSAPAGPPDWNGTTEEARATAKAAAEAARKIAVHGPLLAGRFPGDATWQPFVPAPADLMPFRETVTENGVERPSRDLTFMCLRPEAPDERRGEGCDLPRLSEADGNGKRAAMKNVALRPMGGLVEAKPDKDVPGWWSLDQATRWLATTGTDQPAIRRALSFTRPKKDELLNGVHTLPEDARVHVSIDPDTQTNVDGALFTTEARAFRDAPRRHGAGGMLGADYRAQADEPAMGILCNVHADDDWDHDPALLPLGGERRLTRIESNPDTAPWPAPANIPDADTLRAATRLRLQLVTPAIFAHGWLPGWMADGTPPGLGGMKLQFRLVGVASGRRVPVSGWRLSRRGDSPPGPRATVYAVPAGAVYFFEISGTLTDDIWRKLWLQPVSDNPRHRDEGFGLVLPGLW